MAQVACSAPLGHRFAEALGEDGLMEINLPGGWRETDGVSHQLGLAECQADRFVMVNRGLSWFVMLNKLNITLHVIVSPVDPINSPCED